MVFYHILSSWDFIFKMTDRCIVHIYISYGVIKNNSKPEIEQIAWLQHLKNSKWGHYILNTKSYSIMICIIRKKFYTKNNIKHLFWPWICTVNVNDISWNIVVFFKVFTGWLKEVGPVLNVSTWIANVVTLVLP